MKKLLTILALTLSLTACGSSNNKIEPNKVAINNGSGTEIIGHQSIIYVPEEEVTDDYIKQWYDVIKNEENDHDVIIFEEYRDHKVAKGIWASKYNIEKNDHLEIQDDGTYMMGEVGEEIFKIENGELVK